MKTYAEAKGKEPINWNEVIANPPEMGSAKHNHLCHRALDWVTCACGNQCDAIPRDKDGTPLDEVLSDLGCSFYAAVNSGEWERAEYILDSIEKRSKRLLKQIEKEEDPWNLNSKSETQ